MAAGTPISLTITILSSDHGLYVVEHTYMMSGIEKFGPLIFAGRGVVRRARIRGPVSIMDINACVSYLLACRTAGTPWAASTRPPSPRPPARTRSVGHLARSVSLSPGYLV